MKQIAPIFALALAAACGLTARPAAAQLAPSPSGNMQTPSLPPRSGGDQTLPPAVPGVAEQSPSAVPDIAKPQTGDPTVALFTAINANDYNSARDAISRGADLTARNPLGETPIDLSVGLNRNNITFMLLAARNDSGDGAIDSGPMPMIPGGALARTAKHSAAVPVKLIETPSPAPGNNPGNPDSSAGFLGFGK